MLPRDLNPGDPIYARWLNDLKAAVLADLRSDGSIRITRAGEQITLGLASRIPGVGLFPVVMEQTGGSAGDDANVCSFTYTVTLPTGVELATDFNPSTAPSVWQRAALGAYVAATAGLAGWVNDSGTQKLVVYWCNEVPDPAACA